MGQRYGMGVRAIGLMALLGLAGCMSTGGGEVSRFMSKDPAPKMTAAEKEAAESAIISDLQARRSVLPPGSAYAQVVAPVLEAYSRPAEAELRSARLRAKAASKNWLPRIGPNISLTSLSDIVAQLVVEQVLFDNGRKKAERAFAKADVEAAAVTLAEDTNERVLTALTLYLDAAKARERITLEHATLKDMKHFEWVMNERVKGGVSDMSDLNVLRQKLAEIQSTLSAKQEEEATALAELNAMSARPLNEVSGLGDLAVSGIVAKPLSVLQAEAEKDREIASAKMERAGLLPGVTAGGTLGDGGSGIGVNVKSDQLLGLGTVDSMKALDVAREAANRRVGQAEEDANRRLRRLETRLSALSRQVSEAGALAQQAKANLDLFQRQYDAGQRQVMDVVGVYETFAARQAAQLDLKYDLARTRLELARERGLLADGSSI
ncbi:TolC family protein [Roseovarius sp. MMSF_3281]|uniref:TolC family protein n=1 Tax=Roseovarius sp. MMSF_3281 TaxID=3046694 RepID=UPI00273EEA19|nr:TolC family protein [Roseovarius sp. MMSF_3281]